MKFTTLSLSILALLTSALAAPTSQARDAPGPSGTLQLPQGNANWDNTGGFGLGHVVYQGVSQPYHNSAGVTHVTTHSIDVYLEPTSGSAPALYLARGLAPDPSSLLIDEQFQIPISYGGAVGEYRLVVEETQVGQTPGQPIAITFRAAAPLVSVTAGAGH